jgi:hypothetical protein
MIDIHHDWRSDLAIGPTGDLRLCGGSTRVEQHVLRRLLTSRGSYIWNLAYGAGLGRLVGEPVNIKAVEATVRLQLLQEPAVAADPAPEVRAVAEAGRPPGTYSVNIRYHDAATGVSETLTVPSGR